jgi:hypothetical protein
MQDVQFDSFGEPVKYDDRRAALPPGPVSSWILHAGTGLFWSLVVVIVLARAFYFAPDFASRFGQLEALSQTIRTIFGA